MRKSSGSEIKYCLSGDKLSAALLGEVKKNEPKVEEDTKDTKKTENIVEINKEGEIQPTVEEINKENNVAGKEEKGNDEEDVDKLIERIESEVL